jgi:hypothetical protein
MSHFSDSVNDALNRMKRAQRRGTGCHLTVEMVRALGCTLLAEVWGEDDPRSVGLNTQPEGADNGR